MTAQACARCGKKSLRLNGPVLVCRGCRNKVLQTEWLKRKECIVFQFWRLEFQDRGVGTFGPFPGLGGKGLL